MSGSHSLFAPSSAHRRVDCPASLRVERDLPDSPSFEAVEGTVAHHIHERILLFNSSGEHFVGSHPCQFMDETELTPEEWALIPYSRGVNPDTDFVVSREMVHYVQESVDWCREVPGDHFVEQRVDISRWCPPVYDADGRTRIPQTGTSDHFACEPRRLTITDFKYGTGVKVFAERNYQAILYALGVIDEYDWLYDFDEVVIRIAQPRLQHFDVWPTTKAELLKIGEFILERFTLAMKPDAPFGPSEKACKFCKGASNCVALANEALEMFDVEDDATKDDVRINVEFLTDEQKLKIFHKRALFRLFLEEVEKDIARRVRGGDKSLGLKLVAGRSTRYWKNPAAVVDELLFNDIPEDKIFEPRALRSPAQIEKVLPKHLRSLVSELAEKRPGKPIIVSADDPREEWSDDSSQGIEMFDDESD